MLTLASVVALGTVHEAVLAGPRLKPAWRVPIPAGYYAEAALYPEAIYLAGTEAVVCVDRGGKGVRWTARYSGPNEQTPVVKLTLSGESLLVNRFLWGTAVLDVYDRKTGALRRSLNFPSSTIEGVIPLGARAIVCARSLDGKTVTLRAVDLLGSAPPEEPTTADVLKVKPGRIALGGEIFEVVHVLESEPRAFLRRWNLESFADVAQDRLPRKIWLAPSGLAALVSNAGYSDIGVLLGRDYRDMRFKFLGEWSTGEEPTRRWVVEHQPWDTNESALPTTFDVVFRGEETWLNTWGGAYRGVVGGDPTFVRQGDVQRVFLAGKGLYALVRRKGSEETIYVSLGKIDARGKARRIGELPPMGDKTISDTLSLPTPGGLVRIALLRADPPVPAMCEWYPLP